MTLLFLYSASTRIALYAPISVFKIPGLKSSRKSEYGTYFGIAIAFIATGMLYQNVRD